MNEPFRTAVILRDVEGRPVAEIAEATQATEAAVKSRIYRGRLALRTTLLPYLPGWNRIFGATMSKLKILLKMMVGGYGCTDTERLTAHAPWISESGAVKL